MNHTRPLDQLEIQSIFHPSDFSEASEIAFFHALKIALAAKTELSVLHVSQDTHLDWHEFPGVRETLERWNLIPQGSPKSAVVQLGIHVRKAAAAGSHPVQSSLEFLGRHPADLIVLAIHQHDGRMRWLHRPVGEPIAHKAGRMTLFIPHGVTGFVSREDGSVSLRNILVPITGTPSPLPGVEAAARLIRALALPAGTVTLLHAGAEGDMPAVAIPECSGWTWQRKTVEGAPVDVILQTAAELAADLVVMTTDGADGFLDALRGTTSERVLRRVHCPVLNLPAGSMLE